MRDWVSEWKSVCARDWVYKRVRVSEWASERASEREIKGAREGEFMWMKWVRELEWERERWIRNDKYLKNVKRLTNSLAEVKSQPQLENPLISDNPGSGWLSHSEAEIYAFYRFIIHTNPFSRRRPQIPRQLNLHEWIYECIGRSIKSVRENATS